MPTVPLDRFLPMVLPHCRGVPEVLATRNLRLAAIEFCERTRCWRQTSTIPITVDGQGIAAPSYAAIHVIERATWEDGTDLTPVQFDSVDERDEAEATGQPPDRITQATYNTVRVLPFATGDLTLSLFLKPVNGEQFAAGAPPRDALDVIPDFLWTMHAEAIASGATGRLMLQPNKPWTAPEIGMAHLQRFETAMDRHFAASLRGQHRAPPRTRYRGV